MEPTPIQMEPEISELELDAFEVRALAEVKTEAMVNGDAEEPIVVYFAPATVTLIKLTRNLRTE